MVLGFGTLFIFILSIIAGKLSDILDKRLLLLSGFILGLLYPIIYVLSNNLFQYIIGKFVWALSSVLSWNIINIIFQNTVNRREDISYLTGIKSSFQSIGGSIGSLFGGYLANTYGINFPFYAVAVVYLISLIVYLVFLIYGNDAIYVDNQNAALASIFNFNFKYLILNPYLTFRIITEGITQSHWAMEPIVFPILVYSITQNYTYIGVVFSLMGLIAMFSLPIAGKFVDRVGYLTGLKISFLLYVISFIVLFAGSSFSNIKLFILGSLLLSLGKVFNGISNTRLEVKNIPNSMRGEMLGYIYAYDTITGFISSIAVGMLISYISPSLIFALFGIYTFLGFSVGYALLRRRIKKRFT